MSLSPKVQARLESPWINYYLFPGSIPQYRVDQEVAERNANGLPSSIHYHKSWEPCVAKCKVVKPNEETDSI